MAQRYKSTHGAKGVQKTVGAGSLGIQIFKYLVTDDNK